MLTVLTVWVPCEHRSGRKPLKRFSPGRTVYRTPLKRGVNETLAVLILPVEKRVHAAMGRIRSPLATWNANMPPRWGPDGAFSFLAGGYYKHAAPDGALRL